MSILSEFEDRLGGAIEGAFSTVFRSPVQPAELARAAGKEMGRSRKLGIDKVYVANVYSIFLSPRDGEALGGLTATLEGELETYLLAYAREHDFALATRPVVKFAIDDELKLGRFDVIGEQLTPEEIFEEIGEIAGVTDGVAGVGADMAPVGGAPVANVDAALGVADVSDGMVQLDVPGFGVMTLEPLRSYTLGRQKGCDIFIEDANASRKHARLSYDGRNWTVEDLGSTNGTFVNGREVSAGTSAVLRSGDVLRIGISELQFGVGSGGAGSVGGGIGGSNGR